MGLSVRALFVLFFALAMVLAGAGGSVAEAMEVSQSEAYHVLHADEHLDTQGDEGAPDGPLSADPHACHHHCPSGLIAAHAVVDDAGLFASLKLSSLNPVPLDSTTRAPLLDPPIA